LPNIAQLKDDPDNGKSYALLELFAYGALSDYKREASLSRHHLAAPLNHLRYDCSAEADGRIS